MRKAWLFLALLCVVLSSASFAADPYIGYIYPSGIQAGTTNRFLIGGQNLWRLRGVHFDNSNLRVLDITQVPLFARGWTGSQKESRKSLRNRTIRI